MRKFLLAATILAPFALAPAFAEMPRTQAVSADVNLAKTAAGSTAGVASEQGTMAGAKVGDRDTYLSGERTKTALYDRTKLKQGTAVQGPAILLQGDSTTLIHPDQTAVVVELGQIEIRNEAAAKRREQEPALT